MSPLYKCLIADDNLLDRDVLEMYLSKIDTLSIEAICSDGLEAVALLQQKEIDIVFSDIDMPNLSGMELKKSLSQAPVFIFISSHSEHAAESYGMDVIDFIVKPATLPRLLKAVNKAIEYIELKKNAAAETGKAEKEAAPSPAPASDHFYIKESYDYVRINYADLLYIESMGNFSALYTIHQKKHVTLISLKSIEQQLPSEHFTRIHKQFLVNLQHVLSISSDGTVNITGQQQVSLGDQYKAALLELINKKIFSR